ncbi:LysR family transcriptional regulator [Pseudomonas sp. nanlin1]|uniref:LysR family transcriptional regulator n=1 Tax=Pseudomonas sp. nanlin1 TaxID=3040605 RepID=UPI003890C6A4
MSSVQDRRILYFFEAVRLGSVRAAADYLDVAPSAVSRQIAQLEHELATSLLERHRRGVKPTEAGERVLSYYRQHLTQQELLLDALQALRGLQGGAVSLAIGEGFIEALAVHLNQFSALYPQVELQVNVCGTNEVIRQVLDDEVHLGLVFNPPGEPKLRSHAHQRQPVRVVVNPQHPLTRIAGAVPLLGLDQYRLALPGVAYGVRQILGQAEHRAGLSLAPTLTCNTLNMLKLYAAQGGVTLLPTFMVEQDVRLGTLASLPLQDPVFATPQTHLVSRLGRQLSVAASRLLALLLQDMPAFKGEPLSVRS